MVVAGGHLGSWIAIFLENSDMLNGCADAKIMTLLAWRAYLKERWGGSSRHIFTGRHVRELSYLVPVDDESPPLAHQLPKLSWAFENFFFV